MTKPESQCTKAEQRQDLPSTEEHSILPHTTTQQLNDAREIIRDEAAALEHVASRLNGSFCDAVSVILKSPGNLIVTGVGKAGLIGQKIVATLASTGTRSHFLHPTEALHGDLGCLAKHDVVLAISNSGRSEEVVKLVPILKRRSIPVIALTRDKESQLAASADIVLEIGRHSEAGELKLAPSVSTTAMLAMGDALALVVSKGRGFTAVDFADSHPAGNLGRQFQPVAEVMRTAGDLRIAFETETVRTVMIDRSRPGRRTGAVLLTDNDGRLSGIFTDSDLARLFEQRREHLIDHPIAEVMSKNPTTIQEAAMLPEALEMMKKAKISELPVVDLEGAPVGLVDITDVIDVAPVSQPQANESTARAAA